MRVAARWLAVASLLVAPIAVLGCAGNGGQPPESVEDVRPCLERAGTDVMTPPPRDESFGLTLQRSGWTSAGFVRPPGGSVGLLAFYGTEGATSDVSDALETLEPELLPGFAASRLERHRTAVILWRLPVRDSDRSLLEACLDSSVGDSTGISVSPAKSLACVQVFLSPDATSTEVKRVSDLLREEPLIRKAEFVSKKTALSLLRKRHPELTENLKGNPLPDSFRISPGRGSDASGIARLIRRDPRVDVVRVTALPCDLVSPMLTG